MFAQCESEATEWTQATLASGCMYTFTGGATHRCGTANVSASLVASHTPGMDEARLSLVNGSLIVTPNGYNPHTRSERKPMTHMRKP